MKCVLASYASRRDRFGLEVRPWDHTTLPKTDFYHRDILTSSRIRFECST
jgi:hypothetical protein